MAAAAAPLCAFSKVLLLVGAACAFAGEPAALRGGGASIAGGQSAAGGLAAELMRAVDADGDGASSKQEFLQSISKAAGTPHAEQLGLGVGSWDELFVAMDRDADGMLAVGEAEESLEVLLARYAAPKASADRALSLASLRDLLAETHREAAATLESKLRSRAEAGTSSARRLDDSAGHKAPDPRCEAPKGYPTRPEGFVCLNESALIYCSHGRRWKGEESCSSDDVTKGKVWKGTCKAGLVPDGGCDFPLCHERTELGTYCEQNTVYQCLEQSADGRMELQSFGSKKCSAGTVCRAYDDGPPPSRRRRTRSCLDFKAVLRWICWDDPQPPPYAECVDGSTFV